MNKDFSELIEHLDEKFTKLDKSVENLGIEVKRNQEGIEGLGVEVKRNREGIDNLAIEVIRNREVIKDVKEKMATKVEVGKLLDAVDAYMKQGEDYRQEMVMLGHKVDRHEKWIQQLAQKMGVNLEY